MIKEAAKIHELYNLLEIYAQDNYNTIDIYEANIPESFILSEAKYCLSTFYEPDHFNNLYAFDDEYIEFRKDYRKQIKLLKRFIKKYEGEMYVS